MNPEEIRKIREQFAPYGPGKFEGEPGYVQYFYDLMMNGDGEDGNHGGVHFIIEPQDTEIWPELVGYREIILFESTQGFMGHRLMTKERKAQ